MSINETKFRKEYVETPLLKTDEIEYMGYELPLYDVVTKEAITSLNEYEKELGKTDSYQNMVCDYVRILPHSSIFNEIGLLSITKLTFDFVSRTSTAPDEYIVLYVYGYKNNKYEYLGTSTNVFFNPKVNCQLTFKFDSIPFFSIEEDNGNVLIPYTLIFIRAHRVTIDSNGVIVGGLDDTAWDSVNNTSISLKGCAKNDVMYDPYLTSNDKNNTNITPHVTICYKETLFEPNTKIPHNLNSEIHLSKSDKEKMLLILNLGDLVLSELQRLETIIDTRQGNPNYTKTANDVICASVITASEFVGQTLKSFKYRNVSGGNSSYIITNKWLQADCFNLDGSRVATFLSKRSASQESDYTVYWEFEDFKITDNYNTIEFRLATSGTTRETAYINMSGSSLQDSDSRRLLYKEGWITKWAKSQNVSNIEINNFTADFVLTFEPKSITGLKFIEHLNDANQHITAELREKIDGWIEVADNEVILKDVKTSDYFNYNDFLAHGIIGFTMEVEDDMIDFVINSVDIPRKDDTNLQSSNVHLYAKCFKADGSYDVIYSPTPQKQETNDDKVCTWEFEDFVIKRIYQSISFYFTSAIGDEQTKEVRTRAFLHNNQRLYKTNWKTIWKNNNPQLFTTDFTLHCTKKTSTIIEHPKDMSVHVTLEEKEKLAALTNLNLINLVAELTSDNYDERILLLEKKVQTLENKIEELQETINELLN